MRGSVGLLLLGSFLLFLGIFLQIKSTELPKDTIGCRATITAFRQADESSRFTSPATLVSYTVDGEEYKDVPLGQYEGNWKIGDTLYIYCGAYDHERIWTKTMQYQGWFYMMASSSFLLIAVYKIILFRKKRGQSESDIDKNGEEKFKLSSMIIPLLAGVPLTIAGVAYCIVENNPVLGMIAAALGCICILTGIFSLLDLISFRRRNSKYPLSKIQ